MAARFAKLILPLALLGIATSAAAAPPPDAATQRFEQLLRSIDVTPSRADLDGAWPDARARLLAAAQEATRDDWTRIRAASILALYPDAGVRGALLALAADPRPAVRSTAIHTAARAFGVPGDAALVAALEARLSDPDPDVREHALRGLRWVDHPAAERLLARLAAGDDARARLARRTQQRRAARLVKDGR
ncbi:MAG: hypothetical protein CVU56_28250 [Deltaproteobacteria bacterium HGW-Deltaproteobacteria-14]|jgi:HEAT repeat protein|nr:MAG: hypothetical protein CVU56_28250 [Deltaproteobacteria bacterium HGW-Deltaproteobacteria-14]